VLIAAISTLPSLRDDAKGRFLCLHHLPVLKKKEPDRWEWYVPGYETWDPSYFVGDIQRKKRKMYVSSTLNSLSLCLKKKSFSSVHGFG